MQESELIERNLELSFEFMRYLLTHPDRKKDTEECTGHFAAGL
jgi:hypothetical protein